MAVVLIAAALAAASAPAVSAPASRLPDADPAIWVVNDRDTVIFLFGTFHALDGKSDWFNDEVKTAFASSNELVLETIIPEPGQPAQPGAAEQISSQPLRSLSIAAPSASFLASTRMAVSAGRSKGMDVGHGADAILRHAAETTGKQVAGLESFDFQINIFERIPGGPQPAAAGQDPRVKESLGLVMGQMQSAWNRGEQGIFAAMLEQMRTRSPETYKIMFTDRNTNWAEWIAHRLQKPGTVFVAVGAGHLVGHDSVQAKLAALGVHSARIN